MKRTYVRYLGWITPLVTGVMALFSADYGRQLAAMLMMECVTLGAVNAQRRAMAKSTSGQRVVNLTFTAMLLIALLTAGATKILTRGERDAFNLALTAGVWMLVRCLEEFFDAEGDRLSAWMLDGLSAAALAVPGLIGLGLQTTGWAMAGSLAVGLVIALTTSRKRERAGERFGVDWRLVKEIPMGLLSAGLYPAILLVMSLSGVRIELITVGVGYAVVQMSVTPLRRDKREGVGFGIAMLSVGALTAAVSGRVNLLPVTAACAIGIAIYGAGKWNLMTGAAILTAALFAPTMGLSARLTEWIRFGLAIAALLCTIPEWIELHRQQRVKRIRKKAARLASKRGNR